MGMGVHHILPFILGQHGNDEENYPLQQKTEDWRGPMNKMPMIPVTSVNADIYALRFRRALCNRSQIFLKKAEKILAPLRMGR